MDARPDRRTFLKLSVEDLLLSKALWAKDSQSELQFRDVRQIATAQPHLDWDYVQRWADVLKVADVLRELPP